MVALEVDTGVVASASVAATAVSVLVADDQQTIGALCEQLAGAVPGSSTQPTLVTLASHMAAFLGAEVSQLQQLSAGLADAATTYVQREDSLARTALALRPEQA